jgi:hypothetical protein
MSPKQFGLHQTSPAKPQMEKAVQNLGSKTGFSAIVPEVLHFAV